MSQKIRSILRSRLILIPILLLATFIRFHSIDAHSLWTDEFVSLQLACGRGAVVDTLPRDQMIDHPIAPTQLRDAYPIWRVYTHAMEQDTHPPLYPMVLRGWMTMLGESATAVRGLSAIFSILAVWLLYETARELHGPTIAAWAAALFMAAASQIEFAQLVRSYSMLIAMVLACCWVGVRIEKFGATVGRCVALSALMILSMLTHYYAAPPLLALGVYLLIRLRFRVRIAITFTCSAILFVLIWGYGIWNQHEHFSLNMQWILEDRAGSFVRTMQRAASQPIRYLLSPHHPTPLLALGSLIVLALPWLAIRRRPGILLWNLIAIVSIGVVAITDLVRASQMLEYLRYTAVASAAICAAIVVFLQAFAGRWWQVAAGAIVIAALLTVPTMYNPPTPDFRGMANEFSSQIDSRDALVIFQPPKLPWASDILYFAATHYAQQMPGEAIILTGPAGADVLDRLKNAEHIWIINGSGVDADSLLPGVKIQQSKPFPPLAVVQEGTM